MAAILTQHNETSTWLECTGCDAIYHPGASILVDSRYRGFNGELGPCHRQAWGTPGQYDDEHDPEHQKIRSWIEEHRACPEKAGHTYTTERGVTVTDRRRIHLNEGAER